MVEDLIDLRRITRETLDQLARAGRVEFLPLSNQPTEGLAPEPSKSRARGDAETGNPESPLQLGGRRSAGIRLEEVPEHFFDQDGWSEFVSGCDSRQAALRQISRPEDSFFAFTRRKAAEQPTPVGARARELERIAQLGQRLVADLLACLISGKLAATGMAPPSLERIGIPAELWSRLVPNFEAGTAEGSRYFFTLICITETCDLAPTEVGVAKRIAAWLANRREQHSDELKKTLLHAARDEFAEEFTNRAFDAAYQDIYRRKRGRPRRSQGR